MGIAIWAVHRGTWRTEIIRDAGDVDPSQRIPEDDEVEDRQQDQTEDIDRLPQLRWKTLGEPRDGHVVAFGDADRDAEGRGVGEENRGELVGAADRLVEAVAQSDLGHDQGEHDQEADRKAISSTRTRICSSRFIYSCPQLLDAATAASISAQVKSPRSTKNS